MQGIINKLIKERNELDTKITEESRRELIKNEDKGYIVSFRDINGVYRSINENTAVNFYKDVQKNDYRVLLSASEQYQVDKDTWLKLYDWTVWGHRNGKQ